MNNLIFTFLFVLYKNDILSKVVPKQTKDKSWLCLISRQVFDKYFRFVSTVSCWKTVFLPSTFSISLTSNTFFNYTCFKYMHIFRYLDSSVDYRSLGIQFFWQKVIFQSTGWLINILMAQNCVDFLNRTLSTPNNIMITLYSGTSQ